MSQTPEKNDKGYDYEGDRFGAWVDQYGCGVVLLAVAAVVLFGTISSSGDAQAFPAWAIAIMALLAMIIGTLSRIRNILHRIERFGHKPDDTGRKVE